MQKIFGEDGGGVLQERAGCRLEPAGYVRGPRRGGNIGFPHRGRNRSRNPGRNHGIIRGVVLEGHDFGDFRKEERAEKNSCHDRKDGSGAHADMDSPGVNRVACFR